MTLKKDTEKAKSNRLIQFMGLSLLSGLILACAPQPKSPKATQTGDHSIEKANEKTNIVLILIDDISHYGITAYGADKMIVSGQEVGIHTPNIDKLAEQGFIASNAHTYPLCENTRVALLSGKYNQRNYLKPKALHASEITFSDTFQRAGYKTGLFGKWKQTRGTKDISGLKYISEFGWDEYTAYDVISDTQRFINPRLVVNGETHDYQNRTDLNPETGRRWYGPDIINRHALNFLDKHKDEPFLLYYSMLLIHDDHKPTPDTQPKSAFDTIDEVHHNRDGHSGDDPKYLPDMIAYTDKLIGKVIDRIEALGLSDNTLIVVVGDNGTKEIFTHVTNKGDHYPGRKGGNADNGTHVPLILRHPNIPASHIKAENFYQGMVHITDIYPTIADAAGVTIPDRELLDGKSFWPQATGESGIARENIHHWFIGNNRYHDTDKVVEYVFDQNFKRYAPSSHFTEGRFFDLRDDLLERTGDTMHVFKWGVKRFSGLPFATLNDEQKSAHEKFDTFLTNHKIIHIEALNILNAPKTIQPGETFQISAQRTPRNVTRNGVLWTSSDPSVLSINKFGELKAHKAGTANITVYSWDDAEPLAHGLSPEFKTSGIQDSVTVQVL